MSQKILEDEIKELAEELIKLSKNKSLFKFFDSQQHIPYSRKMGDLYLKLATSKEDIQKLIKSLDCVKITYNLFQDIYRETKLSELKLEYEKHAKE